MLADYAIAFPDPEQRAATEGTSAQLYSPPIPIVLARAAVAIANLSDLSPPVSKSLRIMTHPANWAVKNCEFLQARS